MLLNPVSRAEPAASAVSTGPVVAGISGLQAHFAALVLAAIIFCLDAFTRDDLAIASLYVLVLLIAASGSTGDRVRTIGAWFAGCVLLAITGYLIFQARGAPNSALAHLLISLVVLGTATLLLLRTRAMNSAVNESASRYQRVFNTLAVAIVEHDFTPVAAEIRRLRESGVTDMRRYVEAHPDFVIRMRRLVRITDANATALRMMGAQSRADFVTRLDGFLPEEDESFADCIVAIDERRPLFENETVVCSLTGEPRHVLAAFSLGPEASLHCVPGILLDISHRRGLEQQVLRTKEELAQVQRTGALAAMSASIAHELNQPMAAISSFSEAARQWISRDPPDLRETSDALAGLGEAVNHARVVMQRVRTLVGDARVEREVIDLGALLSTTVALMRRDAIDTATRIVLCGAEPGAVASGDRILLKQMFVNLITNAIQAMAERPPAERMVTLKLRRDDDHAVITVSDRGPGWEDEAEEKVFGSFYTTKRNGMGLGLSICRATVERHGGSIALRQAEGGGAAVEVRVPLIGAAPAA